MNADKIREYFMIDLAMCTVPFNNCVSPKKATLPVSSDGDGLTPVELCQITTTFIRFESDFESNVVW